MPEIKKRLIRVTVDLFVDMGNDPIGQLDDIYTDANKVKVKYNGRVVGQVYDWSTVQVEELKG